MSSFKFFSFYIPQSSTILQKFQLGIQRYLFLPGHFLHPIVQLRFRQRNAGSSELSPPILIIIDFSPIDKNTNYINTYNLHLDHNTKALEYICHSHIEIVSLHHMFYYDRLLVLHQIHQHNRFHYLYIVLKGLEKIKSIF